MLPLLSFVSTVTTLTHFHLFRKYRNLLAFIVNNLNISLEIWSLPEAFLNFSLGICSLTSWQVVWSNLLHLSGFVFEIFSVKLYFSAGLFILSLFLLAVEEWVVLDINTTIRKLTKYYLTFSRNEIDNLLWKINREWWVIKKSELWWLSNYNLPFEKISCYLE